MQVFGGDPGDHSERVYKLKREVLQFRSAVLPLAPAVEDLAAGTVPGVNPKTADYFRDVHDHVLRVGDRIEGYDDLLTGVLQADLARVAVGRTRPPPGRTRTCARSARGRRSRWCRPRSPASTG